MSYSETMAVVDLVNTRLEEQYQTGNPVILEISGRPQLHIASFAPALIYEPYGKFRNKAPMIVGDVALRGLLTRPLQYFDGIAAYLGVQAGAEGYGFLFDSRNTMHKRLLTETATYLGIEGISVKSVLDH